MPLLGIRLSRGIMTDALLLVNRSRRVGLALMPSAKLRLQRHLLQTFSSIRAIV